MATLNDEARRCTQRACVAEPCRRWGRRLSGGGGGMGAAVLRCADVLGGDIMQRAMNAVPVGAKSERGRKRAKEPSKVACCASCMPSLVISSVLDSLELFQNRWLGRRRGFKDCTPRSTSQQRIQQRRFFHTIGRVARGATRRATPQKSHASHRPECCAAGRCAARGSGWLARTSPTTQAAAPAYDS